MGDIIQILMWMHFIRVNRKAQPVIPLTAAAEVYFE